MKFNSETIEKLISNTFEIDCIDIVLTQKTEENPIIYKGPGTISQNENGLLQLKLFSKISDVEKEMSHRFKYHPPGKIINDENYFSLTAVDMSGQVWTSDDIWTWANVSFPVSGQVIKSWLKEIETTEDRSTYQKTSLFLVIPGNFEIPCNEKEEVPNGGWRLNRSIFSSNNIDFELTKFDDFLRIEAISENYNIDEGICNRIIQALSTIMGIVIFPVVVKNTQQDQTIIKIKSVPTSVPNQKLSIPFKHSSRRHVESFSIFIEKYIKVSEDPFSDLFGFWHKVNRAWQANIENSSLSLGVAIEGIVRKYFGELGLPDDEIRLQATKAKEKLNNIQIGERIKRRLIGSISGLLNSASPKGALYKLAQDGLITKEMADVWVKLRNKSVHPDKLNEDPREHQKFIDQIYTCIALF